MGLWSVIVAEATTNLVTNPSFELGTTGWTAGAGTLARSTDDPVSGLYNGKYTPSAAVNDGVYVQACSATAGVTYTFSFYFKGESGVTYRAALTNAGFTNVSTYTEFTGDGEWHRYAVTYTAPATETLLAYITKNDDADTEPFYLDAAQCEAKAYATTYCDGSIDAPVGFDSSGCVWNGLAHGSTSTRSATSRAGGRERDLTDVYGLHVTQNPGVGASPVENFRTAYALINGSQREHSRVAERVFTIVGVLKGSSLTDFHAKRDALVQALMPNEDDEPVLLRYTGTGVTEEISADYEGGLEGGNLNGHSEQVAVRFAAAQPNFRQVIV